MNCLSKSTIGAKLKQKQIFLSFFFVLQLNLSTHLEAFETKRVRTGKNFWSAEFKIKSKETYAAS